MAIVPFKGKFHTPGTLLARIQEDAEMIESFFIMLRMKNGDMVPAHIGWTLGAMAFTGAHCIHEAVHPADQGGTFYKPDNPA